MLLLKFRKILVFLLLITFCLTCLTSCSKFKKTDARKTPINALERAKKNVEEGRGVSLKNFKNKKTTYQFSTSNPMWRASLDILDFLPLVTVDYSGGIIITDWYGDSSNRNDFIKITLRFLSNEIQSNSIKIVVHQKKCDQKNINSCQVNKINSKIEEELKVSIIRKAALFAKEDKKKK